MSAWKKDSVGTLPFLIIWRLLKFQNQSSLSNLTLLEKWVRKQQNKGFESNLYFYVKIYAKMHALVHMKVLQPWRQCLSILKLFWSNWDKLYYAYSVVKRLLQNFTQISRTKKTSGQHIKLHPELCQVWNISTWGSQSDLQKQD